MGGDPKTTLAVVSEGGVRTLCELHVVPPGPGEVGVRIEASGLCHTDLVIGEHPAPLVLGHEGAGVVSEIGDNVTLVPGQHVLLNWSMPCAVCFQCTSGAEHLCERQSPVVALQEWDGPPPPTMPDGTSVRRGFGLGTLATYTVVPEAAVVAIDSSVPFPSAAILGCGVMTGVGSVLNAARVHRGGHVVVIGCGAVGLSVVQGARIAGARSIVAIDPIPQRREFARRFGATHTLAPSPSDDDLAEVARSVHELMGGRGADYAFECTGVARLAMAPLRMIRHGGTAVQVSGFSDTVPVDLGLFMFDKRYLNPLYGQCSPSRDLPELLRMYRSRELMLDEMVTATYPLAEFGLAFDDLEAGRNAKTVVVLQ